MPLPVGAYSPPAEAILVKIFYVLVLGVVTEYNDQHVAIEINEVPPIGRYGRTKSFFINLYGISLCYT